MHDGWRGFVARVAAIGCLAMGVLAACVSAVSAQTSGPKAGTLLIVGGGAMDEALWRRFVRLAGGADARIIVIPTALEDGPGGVVAGGSREVETLKKLGVRDVRLVHTRDRAVADSESFARAFQTATGIWLCGGRQWRLADVYLKTRTLAELRELLARGGVIGGTSAGASIQSDFLVRGDRAGNTLMVGDHQEGFGFLKNAAIDQHLLRRNRQFDLIDVIATRPKLLGIGIDEATAIEVSANRFEVIGAGYVAVYDATSWKPGQKQTFRLLSPGESFDLPTRRVAPRSERPGNPAPGAF